MYGREYAGRELHFEASGGLLNASLVMQDRETSSYWAIMTGEAVEGTLSGTRLREIPVGVKAQWKAWRREHPDTVVLSVDGIEHIDRDPYASYWGSDEGFRGAAASDDRLATKEPVYAFHWKGRPYAVTLASLEGGAAFDLGDEGIFLYRPAQADLFRSTVGFRSGGEGFERKDGAWVHRATGALFDAAAGRFVGDGSERVERLEGFDTFWYNWSLSNPATELLQ